MATPAPRLRSLGRLGVALVALLLAGVAATVMAARPAHANGSPSITAYGGPAQVFVSGYGR